MFSEYILIDPETRDVTKIDLDEGHCHVLASLGKLYNIRTWCSAGFMPREAPGRWFMAFVSDTGWLEANYENRVPSFLQIHYNSPLAGKGILLPMEKGDLSPTGIVPCDDEDPITPEEVETVSNNILWLGKNSGPAAAANYARDLIRLLNSFQSSEH